MRSVERRSNAELSLTVPTAIQVPPPSRLYSQVPLPELSEVIAMPSAALVSTSVTDPPSRMPTCWPPLPVASSSMVGSDGVAGVRAGASLTAVTVMEAVSVAVEKAVVPPLVLASTLVPADPVVWSHAR